MVQMTIEMPIKIHTIGTPILRPVATPSSIIALVTAIKENVE